MDDEELRDKQDRDLELGSPDIEKSPDLDDKSVEGKEGCPTCGSEDIQSAELLEAWKEIEQLKDTLIEAQARSPVSSKQPVDESSDSIDWKDRYKKIKDAYIKTRLEVSGSFGNWDFNTKKRVLEKEISAEVGFTV